MELLIIFAFVGLLKELFFQETNYPEGAPMFCPCRGCRRTSSGYAPDDRLHLVPPGWGEYGSRYVCTAHWNEISIQDGDGRVI